MEDFAGGMTELVMNQPMDSNTLKQMKNITIFPIVPTDETKKSYECLSDLRRLDVQYFLCHPWATADENDEYFSQFHEFVSQLVLKSVNTLVELRMLTPQFFKLFTTVEDLKFPNLQRLSLATPKTMSMQEEILVLKQLNLPKLCPILEHLELKNRAHYWDEVKEDEEIPAEISADGLGQSQLAVGITLECRHNGRYRPDYLRFLNKIYPNMNKVRILKWMAMDPYKLSGIFWDFPLLQYLEINIFRFPHDIHLRLDALLSGIYYDEAFLLSNKRRRSRHGPAWNPCIVPVRPSLFNAKNLLELKISEQVSEDAFMGGNIQRENCVAEITENIPVRHVRNLMMKFETQNYLNSVLRRLMHFSKLIRD